MSNKSKREYLMSITKRYFKAARKQKQKILDEFCAVCGYNRKYAIRLLSQQIKPSREDKGKKGPKETYDKSVAGVLRVIWKTSGYLCSRRLKAALALYLPWYKKNHPLESETEQKLLKISHQTIDRKIRPFRLKLSRHRFSSTKPGTLLKNQIPIKTDAWDVSSPGFLEADTVAHCGDSLSGDFTYTVSCVDILTSWTEQRAIWNKGGEGVLLAVRSIEESLPFALKGFDCDNGSEFLNHHLFRYCSVRPAERQVAFTRSRPYKKDDNAHIEQKNWTCVRRLVGYERLENPRVVDLLNNLYTKEWNWLQNFFSPSMKLVSKKRAGSRLVKTYDTPKTPFQRVLECDCVPQETKSKLENFFQTLNPFELNSTINRKLGIILDNARLPKSRGNDARFGYLST